MFTVRPWLYIGKHRDAENLPQLQAYHIRGMLQLEEPVEQPGIHTLFLPVQDGVPISENDYRRGIKFMLLEHQLGRNVLIACATGISRSITFAIAALKETEGSSLLSAYGEIVQEHAMALPHPALWQSLCAYYQENIPYVEVLKRYNRAKN
ncbi:hypothetical protein GCM10023188_31980 [Pontibacter saemangeumensis]|uniref:Tyrosine-protein phosphatase domain-containing protein n=1 Tax=Pontibacter saemangeumensis TaxID=1084525 RepID=A0ABP8LY61_9BACT